MPFAFDNSYARLPSHFYSRVSATPVRQPSLVAFNEPLAESLGLEPGARTLQETAEILAGNRTPEGACSIAVAYAGHQFGSFVPQLGDGRAILLGEVIDRRGQRMDIVLKGAGRTPYSRGGDGRAALGPVLREYLVSEAMAALGVPTTRALGAVTTGEDVYRTTRLPGAILTRVASSHLRVGTFQYFAVRRDKDALRQLTDHALLRHYPGAHPEACPALTLLACVIEAQAKLIAKWQALGFIHGVMNTDNTSISGETIDYGPCAFLDTFVPNRKFSSIDHGGRYAYDEQPKIAHWNVTRLAEALLSIIDADEDIAIERAGHLLDRFPEAYNREFARELRRKLGLVSEGPKDLEMAESLLRLMADDGVDFTLCFRKLSDCVSPVPSADWLGLFKQPERALTWHATWFERLQTESGGIPSCVARLDSQNPAFIARNHLVEESIARAYQGDFTHFEQLKQVLSRPYESQPEHQAFASPPGEEQWNYRTFCGT